jgi:hypothetical protein
MKHTLNISPLIAAKQQTLLQDVLNKQRYFLPLRWNTNKTLRIDEKKEKVLDMVLHYRTNHTNYTKISHEIVSLSIAEKVSRNPHIKL